MEQTERKEPLISNSDDMLNDIRSIIESSRENAYQAVNTILVKRNWLLGKRISEEEMKNEGRAEYGMEIIKKLSKALTDEYGKGFTKSNLYSFYSFYKTFPEIFHSASGKSLPLLSWNTFYDVLHEKDDRAIDCADDSKSPALCNGPSNPLRRRTEPLAIYPKAPGPA
jgi:hypothetical protein